MVRIFLVSVLLSFGFTQNSYDVLRPFWGFNHSQILSNSIGDATVASGYITPGITSNPANLGTVSFGYVQMNLSNNKFISNSSEISSTGFNGIDFVQPIPVYKGSLVFSAGGHRVKDYLMSYNTPLSEFENSDYTLKYREKGKMNSYHIGAAVEFARGIYFGADLKLLSGSDEMTISYESDSTDYYSPKYTGLSLTVGMLHKVSDSFQYGLSVDLPTSLSVREEFVYSNHINSELSYSGQSNYRVSKPLTLHLGMAYLTRVFNVFYEARHTDWQGLEFESDDIYESDLELPASVFINEEIRSKFSQQVSHHLGTALRVPVLPLNIFAGYQYSPFPEKSGHYGDEARETYSLGFSIAVKRNILIQGSLDTHTWDFEGVGEQLNKISLGVSVHELPRR